jgi:hypothetical protein
MRGKAMIKQEEAPGERKQKWNWRIWSGFLLAVAAVPGGSRVYPAKGSDGMTHLAFAMQFTNV